MTVYYDGGTIYFPDGTSMNSAGSLYNTGTGYERRSNGILFQWGSGSYSQPQVIYFPTTFPNTCWLVTCFNNWNQGGITSTCYSWNQSYFYTNRTYYLSWFAVGY